ARCESLRAARVSLSADMTWQGQRLQSKLQIAFTRTATGIRLRVDVNGPGREAHAVIDGRRSTVWIPGSQMVMRQEMPRESGGRWDAFANPVVSLLALLSPSAEDHAAIQRTFVPPVRLLSPAPPGGD